MSEQKGCSVVAVVLVALLMLVVGVAVGGGVVWVMYVADAPQPVTVVQKPVDPDPTPPPSKGQAVLFPLEETLRIEGPMPPQAVKDVLLKERFKLRDCYQAGVDRSPDLRGEMSLQFTVAGSNGAVTAAVERHTNFSDKQVRDCILKHVKGWNFPPDSEMIKKKAPPRQSVVKFDVLMMGNVQ